MGTDARIVASARARLLAEGFHGLSMETVAAGAGVTRMTVYRRFGSKLGLLEAVAEDLAVRGDVVARAGAALAEPAPVVALHRLVRALLGFWATDPELLLRLVTLAGADPAASAIIERRDEWRLERLAEVVGRLDADGALAHDADTTHALLGAVTSFTACHDVATRLGSDIAGAAGPIQVLVDACLAGPRA